MRPRNLVLGVASAIFLTITLFPCMGAEDPTEILKAESEMLGNQAKAYTDFLKDIGIVVGALVVFLGFTTWRDMKAAIKNAVDGVRAGVEASARTGLEKVRADVEASAKTQMDTTLKELFEAHRAKIKEQIAQEIRIIKEQLEEQVRQSREDANDMVADLAHRTVYGQALNVTPTASPKILWVDDHPENNAYEVEILRKCGATVHEVKKTENALQELTKADWKLLISDMGRDGNSRAGLDLLMGVRARGAKLDVIFYASQQAQAKFADEAARYGAIFTTRPQELFAATHTRLGIPPD
jgi:CheY-like chemotaxis protein